MNRKRKTSAKLLLAFFMLTVIMISAFTVAFAEDGAAATSLTPTDDAATIATAQSSKFTLGEGEDAID